MVDSGGDFAIDDGLELEREKVESGPCADEIWRVLDVVMTVRGQLAMHTGRAMRSSHLVVQRVDSPILDIDSG